MEKSLRIHKLLCILGFLGLMLGSTTGNAQYGNEWIDHSLTYYKFKIAKNGIYRIPYSTLSAAGLSGVNGADITLYRNGQKVHIYITTSGVMGTEDYIEFYGEKSDGLLDAELYTSASTHPTTYYSMFTDTAVYYLAVESGPHPRFTEGSFTIPDPLPTPEPYIMTEVVSNNGNRPNVFVPGRSYASNDNVYKSSFDNAEGFILNYINSNNRYSNNTITTPKRYVATPTNSYLEVVYTNGRATTSSLQFLIGNNVIKDTTLIGYGLLKRRFTFETSLLSSNTNVRSRDMTSLSGFNLFILEYPRLFNYIALETTYTRFYLYPGTGYKYLVFTDITGMETTYLYDLGNKIRYTGIPQTANSTQFYVPTPSEKTPYVFLNSPEIVTINELTPIQFTDYSDLSRQGNYIILTHKGYIDHPSNPIGQYAAYRSSSLGGGFNVTVVDVTELYDQFGWGYDFHPAAVKRFLHFAYNNWEERPTHLFIIGKGLLYNLYKNYLANPSACLCLSNLVPTFGNPGSDNLFSDFDNNNIPEIATGRLSAWNADQILKYLEKVKAYEDEIRPAAVPNLENTLWKKKAMMIAGSNEADQAGFIVPAFNVCTNVFKDTFIGGLTTIIKKNTTGIVPEETDDQLIKKNLLNGTNRLVFYGHAFSTGFDYNLNVPDELVSYPRFPNFIAMGCNVSQVFETINTISEDFINSEMGGAVSLIASNSLGYPTHLSSYLNNYFRTISYGAYDKTIGEQYRHNIATVSGIATNGLFILHLQNIILQGDPGLAVYAPEVPDYYTDNTLIKSSVNPLMTSNDSAVITTVIYNLGRATKDSVMITLEHQKPNGTIIYHTDTLKRVIKSLDTVRFTVYFDKMEDIGLNRIVVRVNPSGEIPELSMAQNTAVLDLFMSADVVQPIYPYDYAIVYESPVTLKASTLSMFRPGSSYILQIDTTEEFNSPFLKQTIINSDLGGLLTWTPPISLVDSQVYYWRATYGSTVTDSSLWITSSFVYLKDGSDGWNQSHYYQFLNNEPYTNLVLRDTNRIFSFGQFPNKVIVFNRIYSSEYPIAADVRTLINNAEVDKLGCDFNGTIKFILINPENAQPVPNGGGDYGSVPYCISGNRNVRQFEFSLKTAADRKKAADFIDAIPDGYYVIVSNFLYDEGGYWTGTVVPEWTEDATLYGETNTLYYKLKELGFEQIDSFDRKRVFIFVTKKDDPTFENITAFSDAYDDLITVDFDIYTPARKGDMSSVLVGPAMEWKNMLWEVNHPKGNATNDTDYVEIFGVSPIFGDSLLVRSNATNIDLSAYDASIFPSLRLKWYTRDTTNGTSSNLRYWRVLYSPLPEGALNPIRHYVKVADTVYEGQKLNYQIAFDNLTKIPFADSLLVHYTINKADGTSELIHTQKIKKLSELDTAIASLSLDPRHYPGKNTIMVDVNPDNLVPELYHPNNFTYFTFYQKADSTNPILDVTFDGVHILDRDIVSAKPFIKIMLKDENIYSPLADTNLLRVQIVHPGSTTPEEVPIDGTIAKFIPASGGDKNEAFIEYTPTFTKDGVYKLIVSGQDEAGNIAGSAPHYEIHFTIETKPSVTNLLNYPNPFSTSTAFVFTLTGSEVPQQFKIQIMTVTGKIVREITKQELGPIHIGRNITEYKWDGRDQYGQLLGNGVYLYRLVTELNGNAVEHRQNEAIDKYFNKSGFGKMYIMR